LCCLERKVYTIVRSLNNALSVLHCPRLSKKCNVKVFASVRRSFRWHTQSLTRGQHVTWPAYLKAIRRTDCVCCDIGRTFLRGQNVPVDPTVRHEQEEKRRQYVEHQA